MGKKRRPLKTDEDTIADFWNQLNTDEPAIKKFFRYWIRKYPSGDHQDSFHDLIMSFYRLDTFKRFDPSRIVSTAPRNATLKGKYHVYLFKQVEKVLRYGYNERKLYRSREALNEELTTRGGLPRNDAEVKLYRPIKKPKEAEKETAERNRKRRIRYETTDFHTYTGGREVTESVEFREILAILKENLDEKYYNLLMSILDGQNLSEVADEWGVSCQAIRMHMSKIKDKIEDIKGLPQDLRAHLHERTLVS